MNLLLRTLFAGICVLTAVNGARAASLDDALRAELSTLPHLAGEPIGAETLGGQVVLVNFFASWCPPCHKEFRHLNKLYRDYAARGLKIVSVNYLEDFTGFKDNGARLHRFLSKYQPEFSVIRGNDEIARKFDDVQRIPTVFIFDKSGKQTFHFIHRYKAKKMNPTIEELRAALHRLLPQPQ